MKLELTGNEVEVVGRALMCMASDFMRYKLEAQTEEKRNFFESYQTAIEDIYFRMTEGNK